MSRSVQVTIDDAQFDLAAGLGILKAVLTVLRQTGKSYEDRILYQNLSEAREELERALQVLEALNKNGRTGE